MGGRVLEVRSIRNLSKRLAVSVCCRVRSFINTSLFAADTSHTHHLVLLATARALHRHRLDSTISQQLQQDDPRQDKVPNLLQL